MERGHSWAFVITGAANPKRRLTQIGKETKIAGVAEAVRKASPKHGRTYTVSPNLPVSVLETRDVPRRRLVITPLGGFRYPTPHTKQAQIVCPSLAGHSCRDRQPVRERERVPLPPLWLRGEPESSLLSSSRLPSSSRPAWLPSVRLSSKELKAGRGKRVYFLLVTEGRALKDRDPVPPPPISLPSFPSLGKQDTDRTSNFRQPSGVSTNHTCPD
ncbi:uncharacterized protein LOC114028266 [Vombatus ursinus]|uniref:uncharacterized protein LOC114028266 n=1 Tax=Vombatus ursinus TaxID=29139 RepID=UPI000FFD057B|nr:uncharacterized protein LOC114028266 [Vombatus ursinus]